jgi:hypothetical protein
MTKLLGSNVPVTEGGVVIFVRRHLKLHFIKGCDAVTEPRENISIEIFGQNRHKFYKLRKSGIYLCILEII